MTKSVILATVLGVVSFASAGITFNYEGHVGDFSRFTINYTSDKTPAVANAWDIQITSLGQQPNISTIVEGWDTETGSPYVSVFNDNMVGHTSLGIKTYMNAITVPPMIDGIMPGVEGQTFVSSWRAAYALKHAPTSQIPLAVVYMKPSSWFYLKIKTGSGLLNGKIEVPYDNWGFVVPEPATMGLLMIGTLGLLRRKHT